MTPRPATFVVPASLRALVLCASACLALSGCYRGAELMPTPHILLDADLNPFDGIDPSLRGNAVDVLYATDRVPMQTGGFNYSYDRSASLAWGSCVVEIGKRVPWNTLVESSRTLRRTVSLPLAVGSIEERGRFPDTPLPVLLAADGRTTDSPEALAALAESARAFNEEVSRRVRLSDAPEALVFVHGYNNTFRDAAFVVAELWHFLGRRGVPIAYSWPAGVGGLRGYTYDRESGEFTNYHFKLFLRTLAANPEIERIHIVAHSRGTDVATTALRELFLESRAAGRDPRSEFKIANLILAAPDLDMQVGMQRVMAERVPLGVGATTIYVSTGDRALGLSDWLFRGIARVGRLQESDMSDTMKRNMANASHLMNFVQLPGRAGLVGHSYFHTDPRVSADLLMVLRKGAPPGAEHGRPLTPLAPGYWILPADYKAGNPAAP